MNDHETRKAFFRALRRFFAISVLTYLIIPMPTTSSQQVSSVDNANRTSGLSDATRNNLAAPYSHIVALPSSTLANKRRPVHPDWMKLSPEFDRDLQFWVNIYSKYRDHEVVLHDPRRLDVVYTVINLERDYYRKDLPDEMRRKILSDRIESERKKITERLTELYKNPTTASKEALKLAALFPSTTTLKEFKRASAEVRAQWGQKDKFYKGLEKSGEYLGQMELIFARAGVPPVITRLAFVESTFVYYAVSSSAAVGLWQFMPHTGSLYMKINNTLDERLDPLISTEAAAKLLMHNYQELGSWPLAINAYNTGKGRILQGMAQHGTRSIETLMRNFENTYYGFASRNFFLEFLAAANVADNYPKHFGNVSFRQPLKFVEVTLPKPCAMIKLVDASSTPLAQMKELNQQFKRGVWSGDYLVAANYPIKVPVNDAARFVQYAPNFYVDIPPYHIVRRHETWESIAAKYDMHSNELKAINRQFCSSKRKCKLKEGWKLALQ